MKARRGYVERLCVSLPLAYNQKIKEDSVVCEERHAFPLPLLSALIQKYL